MWNNSNNGPPCTSNRPFNFKNNNYTSSFNNNSNNSSFNSHDQNMKLNLHFATPYSKRDRHNKQFPFKFKELLDSGSQAKVYIVKNRSNNKIYASKEIFTNGWDSAQYSRWKKEMEALEKTKNIHLSIPSFVYTAQNIIYLIAPLARCGDGHKLSAGSGTLPMDTINDIMLQVCDGIQAMHNSNMVHRDIKPSNILLHESNRSNKFHAQLTDFGISKTVFDVNTKAIQSRWGNESMSHPIALFGSKCLPYNVIDYYGLVITYFVFVVSVNKFNQFVSKTFGKNNVVGFFEGLRKKCIVDLKYVDENTTLKYVLDNIVNGVNRKRFNINIFKQKMMDEINLSKIWSENSRMNFNGWNKNDDEYLFKKHSGIGSNVNTTTKFKNQEIEKYLSDTLPTFKQNPPFYAQLFEYQNKSQNAKAMNSLEQCGMKKNMATEWWSNICSFTNKQMKNIEKKPKQPDYQMASPNVSRNYNNSRAHNVHYKSCRYNPLE